MVFFLFVSKMKTKMHIIFINVFIGKSSFWHHPAEDTQLHSAFLLISFCLNGILFAFLTQALYLSV